MRSYYEESIFKVVEVREDVPVYRIQNVRKPKDVRTVHRNKLLKVDELPLDVFDEKGESSKRKKKQKSKESEKDTVLKEKEMEKEVVVENDSDDDFAVVVEQRRVIQDITSDSTYQSGQSVAGDNPATQELWTETPEDVGVDGSDEDVERDTADSDAVGDIVDSEADGERVDAEADEM